MVNTTALPLGVVYTGLDYSKNFAITKNSVVLDVTGYVFSFKVRRVGGSSTVLSKSVTITDATNGLLQLTLTTVETAALVVNEEYEYQLQGLVNGQTFVFANGSFVTVNGW